MTAKKTKTKAKPKAKAKPKVKPTTYNGWTNRETWAIALHIANDRFSYDLWRARAYETWRDRHSIPQVKEKIWKPREGAIFVLADAVHDGVHDIEFDFEPHDAALMVQDLFNCALSRVNWDEIAKDLLADAMQGERTVGHDDLPR